MELHVNTKSMIVIKKCFIVYLNKNIDNLTALIILCISLNLLIHKAFMQSLKEDSIDNTL